MTKLYYFLCGLPRSGTTLLSGILKQNPLIHASMSSNVHSLFCEIQFNKQLDVISTNEQQAEQLYKNTLNSHYYNIDRDIIFDTCRGWPRFIGVLPRIFPYTKLIVCLRDIPSIINSFEYFYLNKNIAPAFVKPDGCNDPWIRFEFLYNSFIENCYNNCEYMYFSEELSKHCIFIDYDTLITNPVEVVNNLYNQLNIPSFEHNYNNIDHSFDEVDNKVNNENLHKVYSTVGKTPTKWILPRGVVEKYNRPCFWKGER